MWLKNNKLIEMVKEHAIQHGDFTLSSGMKSKYFIDMSKVTNRSDCLDIICDSILRHVKDSLKLNIDAVGGPALGVAPLIGGMLIARNRDSHGQSLLNGFLIRKEDSFVLKDVIEGNLKKGDKVLMVEDVVTTGTQLKRACSIVYDYGAEVVSVIAILDRSNGEAKKLLGDKFDSMMTLEDLDLQV